MNDTLNSVLDTAGRVGRAAVKTTSGLVDKGRDRARQMAAQARMAKIERQLGALVYALRKNDEENEAMVNWYIAEIDRLKAKIAMLDKPEKDRVMVFEWPKEDLEVQEDAMFRDGSGDELPEG